MTDPTGDDDESGGDAGPSFSELMGEATDLGQRGARAWAEVREDWESRSQTDAPWTTDTIMNEVVNSWERVTPLIGEALDTSIAGFSWMLDNWWPSAADDLDAAKGAMEDTAAGEMFGPYMDVPREAVSRIKSNDYRSADAVEHWAQLFGMSAKNAWRAAANAGPGEPTTPQPNAEAEPDPADDDRNED